MAEPSRDFFEGLGALAYALVKADGQVDEAELNAVGKSILSGFGSWASQTKALRANGTFELLANEGKSAEAAYQHALEKFLLDKRELKTYRVKTLDLLTAAATADQIVDSEEASIILRFKQDTENL